MFVVIARPANVLSSKKRGIRGKIFSPNEAMKSAFGKPNAFLAILMEEKKVWQNSRYKFASANPISGVEFKKQNKAGRSL